MGRPRRVYTQLFVTINKNTSSILKTAEKALRHQLYLKIHYFGFGPQAKKPSPLNSPSLFIKANKNKKKLHSNAPASIMARSSSRWSRRHMKLSETRQSRVHLEKKKKRGKRTGQANIHNMEEREKKLCTRNNRVRAKAGSLISPLSIFSPLSLSLSFSAFSDSGACCLFFLFQKITEHDALLLFSGGKTF